MRKQGIVSLWLGKTQDVQEFEKALEVAFSEDGEFLGSQFSNAFNLGYYSDVEREAELVDPSSDLHSLLDGFSHSSDLLSAFDSINVKVPVKTNAVVLLYNFVYSGEIMVSRVGELELSFFGSVELPALTKH